MFFLVTNMLIVFGLVAFDNALAVLQAFPALFPIVPRWPSPLLLVKALLTSESRYDEERIQGLRDAVQRLSKKSRSFYLASGTFEGRTRIDLILLYSFCRVADDLVDESKDSKEAASWVAKLRQFLDLAFESPRAKERSNVGQFVDQTFPSITRTALRLLPTAYLSKEPLMSLMDGFDTDLKFLTGSHAASDSPIHNLDDLQQYGERVAGTVARLCLDIVFHHHGSGTGSKEDIVTAGNRMGVALQVVNIARDIAVDAKIGRVYIPSVMLAEQDLSVEAVLKNPKGTRIDNLRQSLLRLAFRLYYKSKNSIEQLPVEVRAPMRVAVESYMEIGRVLGEEKGYRVKAGRATVPKVRRIWVAWKALNS